MKNVEIMDIDYSGINPTYQCTETMNIADIPTPFILPDQTPFYTKNFTLRGDGVILARGKDYWFEDHLTQFEEKIGKSICATIKLSTQVLENYKTISIVYQKVFDPIITRKYLLESIESIFDSDKPFDWNDLLGVPETFPPAYHTHDVREKDEIVGFGDLVILFKQATGKVKLGGMVLYDSLNKIRDAAYERLNSVYQAQWDALFAHIENPNNPHGITATDIGLGSHPNWGTATVAQDVAGTATNVISTPKGVAAAIENTDVSADGFVRQGSLPFSYYGSGIYIPPTISGSFEGLGTNTGGTCLGLESNGWLVALMRGYDTKVRNLYYYYKTNPWDKNEEFVFSGYKYEHPAFTRDGFVPNHVICGSNGVQLLFIGDKEKNQYYIGLPNGTLDANSHLLRRINMSSLVFADGTNAFSAITGSVFRCGEYVYYVGQVGGYYPGQPPERQFGSGLRKNSLFRLHISELSIESSDPVSFERVKVNYTNCRGEVFENQDYFDLAPSITEVDETGKRYGIECCYIFTGETKYITSMSNGNPWHRAWYCVESDADKTIGRVIVNGTMRYNFSAPDSTFLRDVYFQLPYTFDSKSNTLTLEPDFFQPFIEARSGARSAPEGRNLNEYFNSSAGSIVTMHGEQASAFIPKLGFITIGSTSYYLPYVFAHFPFGYNPKASGYEGDTKTDFEIFSKNFVNFASNGHTVARNIKMNSPFGFTGGFNSFRDCWDYNGKVQDKPLELFNALNENGSKSTFFREPTANIDFIERPELQTEYVNKKIMGREPTSVYGEVKIGECSPVNSSKHGVVGTNRKDQTSTQWGVGLIHSRMANATSKNQTLYGNIYSSISGNYISHVIERDGFGMTLLSNVTYDKVNGTVTITPDLKKSVWLTSTQINQLIKEMTGDLYGEDFVKDDWCDGDNCEWALDFFISADEGVGENVIPSYARLTFHYFDDVKITYAIHMLFNWNKTGVVETGEMTIDFTNFRFPWERNGKGVKGPFSTAISPSGHYWSNLTKSFGATGDNTKMFIEFQDNNNFDMYYFGGGRWSVPGNSSAGDYHLVVNEGVMTNAQNFQSMYNAASIALQMQLIPGFGNIKPVSSTVTGNAVIYGSGGKISGDSYVLLESTFAGSYWSLFIISDQTVVFNGSEKTLKQTVINLDQLGIDQTNKVFYLYAVSGKNEGFYDLTLAERTASPYHLLVAVVTTNALGINNIEVQQNFAISGFSISTSRNGGIVPASAGTQVETGNFNTITYDELFDVTKYN